MKVVEGKVKIETVPGRVSKQDVTFYNPHMAPARDVFVSFMQALEKPVRLVLPFAGTGVRGIRAALETGNVEKLLLNDKNPSAVKLCKKNVKANKLTIPVDVEEKHANLFLLESRPASRVLIDLDPFGTPVPFLDSAFSGMREGFLAMTATDTAVLCGRHFKACPRKYQAKSLQGQKELGMRILVRRVQLAGALYDLAVTPILCHSERHYFRAYFSVKRSKKGADSILKQHDMFQRVGPLWTGPLQDKKVLHRMKKVSTDETVTTLINQLLVEDAIGVLDYMDIHFLCKALKVGSNFSMQTIITALEKKGFSAARSHYSDHSIKTNAPKKVLEAILKKKT